MTVNLVVSVGRNKYNISCEVNEQERIIELAQKLNKRVNVLSMVLGRLSDTVLLFVAGINIQREIEIVQNKRSEGFLQYLTEISRKINNIIPANSVSNDKEERDRFFLSCLNLENELYNLTKGEDINFIELEKNLDNKNEISEKKEKEMEDKCNEQIQSMINLFDELTETTTKLSVKIRDL
jgi:cell division protein ZapA (FtsZ GTPase activity inhibitor)